jgi:hypothetical protein
MSELWLCLGMKQRTARAASTTAPPPPLFDASAAYIPIVVYAVEFLCMCAAKLMVLDRMMVFAAPPGAGIPKLWAAAGRAVMAAVVLGNAVGLAANVAAAVHYDKAAQAASKASAYYAANNTKDGDEFRSLGRRLL